MKKTAAPPIRPARLPWRTVLALCAIAAACFLAYANSLHAPFVFDDLPAITTNPSIRELWPLNVPLSPPPGSAGADGRPLVNFSLAINYALGGLAVEGYHAFNLVAHCLVAFTLFGLTRLTLSLPSCPAKLQARANLLAAVATLIWSVHPLLTESVTCVVQRNEILVALFLLLTLYSLGRSRLPPHATGWLVVSVLSCFCGMACKEVMACAPLVALLYDRAFIAGSLAGAWRARGRYYSALACSWILLGLLIAHADRRSGTVGFGLTVSPGDYLLTQCRAIVLYLKLSVWPHPLVVDYGAPVVRHLSAVWWQAASLCAAAAGTGWALVRRPKSGWLACCFFALLAPSSSVVPLVTQTIAEHRMYLPLATLVCGAVLGVYALGGRFAVGAAFALLPVLAAATVQRNRVYRSGLTLWTDTVAHAPDNARAHNNLGNMLLGTTDGLARATAEFETAVRLEPDYIEGLNNLANALTLLRPPHLEEAVRHYEHALRLRPNHAEAENNYGFVLSRLPGRGDEAIAHLKAAIRLRPLYPEAYFNLGLVYTRTPGHAAEALLCFETALRQRPDFAEAHHERATLLLSRPDRLEDAIAGFETALRLKPDYAQAHHNLGIALARQPGRLDEAIAQLEQAARIDPEYFSAFLNLGLIYRQMPGHTADARENLERAVALRPDSTRAREALVQLNARDH